MQEIRTNFYNNRSFFEVTSKEFVVYCQQILHAFMYKRNRVTVVHDSRTTFLKLRLNLHCFISIGYTSHRVMWLNKSRSLEWRELNLITKGILDDLVKPTITTNAVLVNHDKVYYMFNSKTN